MADQFRMDPSGQPVWLANGLSLSGPGMDGFARVHTPMAADVRGPDLGTETLNAALAATGWSEQVTLELEVERVSDAVSPGADVRGPSDEPALELAVDDPGEGWGMAVLAQDEAGALTWHFPLDEANQVLPPTRGGTTRRFRLPRSVVLPPDPTDGAGGATRGLLGMAGRKLFKVLLYPVADRLLGPIGEAFARNWEAKHRSPQVRRFDSRNYQQEDRDLLTRTDWKRLQKGRALLFIHGTFSRSAGAFGGLAVETMQALEERYGGRLFAYDHPSVSVDPTTNARWLLEAMPRGTKLEVDVITHSRGGLVARALAELGEHLGVPDRNIDVKRAVFVGVPNQGTPLAHGDHMIRMVDRLTTAINLFPSASVQVLVEGMLTVVKLIGHGMLSGLPGLAAMRPSAEARLGWLTPQVQALDRPRNGLYYAITSNFDAAQVGLGHLIRGGADRTTAVMAGANAVMDVIFQGPNDLVVPTMGVYEANGHPNFPVHPDRLFDFGKNKRVTHVNFFGQPETQERLKAWLLGEGDSGT